MEPSFSQNIQLHFQLNNQMHNVEVKLRLPGSILKDGMEYEILGNQKGSECVQQCFANMRSINEDDIIQIGKELKARLWAAGAKDIIVDVSTSANETHRIALRTLGNSNVDAMEAVDDTCTLVDVRQIITTLCQAFEDEYFDPIVGQKVSDYLSEQMEDGAYEAISDPIAFAQGVLADLRLITADKHIQFYPLPPKSKAVEAQEAIKSEPLPNLYATPDVIDDFQYKSNFAPGVGSPPDKLIYELKSGRLKSNPQIGYLDVRTFGLCRSGNQNPELKEDMKIRKEAFMKAVKNLSKAESGIIIDLRHNGGGDPTGVQLLCSLFMSENIPLNNIEWRRGDWIESYSTLSKDELPLEDRLLESKQSNLVLLIGPYTFSAAEEFANNMKVLERATIVGEISMGGANPGCPFPVGENFEVFIPNGRAVNPHTNSNWEGVGVTPDHVIPVQDALEEAVKLLEQPIVDANFVFPSHNTRQNYHKELNSAYQKFSQATTDVEKDQHKKKFEELVAQYRPLIPQVTSSKTSTKKFDSTPEERKEVHEALTGWFNNFLGVCTKNTELSTQQMEMCAKAYEVSSDEYLSLPPGKMVDVGGYQLHVNVSGTYHEGVPAIVLESGLKCCSSDWQLVAPKLEEKTQVFSYDRAGYGWSDPSTRPVSGENIVADLKSALSQSSLQPPYILVGHSMGGVYMQLYALTYPEDVAGIVLVDATNWDRPGNVIPLEPAPIQNYSNIHEWHIFDNIDKPVWAAQYSTYNAALRFNQESTSRVAAIASVREKRKAEKEGPALPAIVLSHGRLEEDEPPKDVEDWKICQEALFKEVRALKHTTVADSGHSIQYEDPQLVIESIKDVMDEVNKRR